MAAANASFNPAFGQAITVSATGSSVSGAVGDKAENLVVTSLAEETLFFRTGEGSATATAADYALLAGQQISITKPTHHDYFAAIGTDAGGDVHVIPGKGI